MTGVRVELEANLTRSDKDHVDGVAQLLTELVDRRTQDPKDRGLNLVRSTRKNCELFQVKK